MATVSTSESQKVAQNRQFWHLWLGNVLRATTASKSDPNPLSFWHFRLGNVLRATTACTFSTAQLPKVVRSWRCLCILTWKCASRHNGVHFFDISTSKTGLRPWVFNTFDLEMCFAPQQRALFRQLNFQKWSEAGVVCAFWLGNVLRATTVCTFSTSQLPKLVWDHGFLTLLTWKCASRHNSMHFFDSSTWKSGPNVGVFLPFLLTNVLRATTARTFSSLIWPAGSAPAALAMLLFDPPEPQIILKNRVNRDFLTFSRTCIFSLLIFSPSDLLTSWLLLSDSSHLCFSISAYCRKFDF